MKKTNEYEAVVIGGGPAGLQAALTLGRVHRRTLLVDSGRYRNDPATHMHNFIGHDGTPPAELRAAAREDLAGYDTVTVREARVDTVAVDPGGFRVEMGPETVTARGIVLATGLRDILPDLPGVADLFGGVVAVCPFCHGHEFAGRPVAVLGAAAAHVGAILEPVASSVTSIAVEDVLRFEGTDTGARVWATDGTSQEFAGIFITTGFEQSAPFAGQLGLHMLESGCVEVDSFQATSLPGVFAAGDLAHTPERPMPMPSVLGAAAAGQMAGSAMVQHLL